MVRADARTIGERTPGSAAADAERVNVLTFKLLKQGLSGLVFEGSGPSGRSNQNLEPEPEGISA
jgi:hypothetical protein